MHVKTILSISIYISLSCLVVPTGIQSFEKGFNRLLVKNPSEFSLAEFEKKLKFAFPSELWTGNETNLIPAVKLAYFPNFEVETLNSSFFLNKYSEVCIDFALYELFCTLKCLKYFIPYPLVYIFFYHLFTEMI